MHEHDGPDLDKDLLSQFGYEREDVPFDRRLTKYTVGFFGFFLASVVVAWGFISLVDRTQIQRPDDESVSRRKLPPAPLLQSDATAKLDMVKLRRAEGLAMKRVQWVDQAKGITSIPVELAEEIVAKRGLPTRANAKEPEERRP